MRYHDTNITVRFNEVDAYRVAWHGHYVAWMEAGRNELAGRFGLDAMQLAELGFYGPVVGLELQFLNPARFSDTIVVRTSLCPRETATLVFASRILGGDGRMLATGKSTHVLTNLDGILQYQLPAEVGRRMGNMTAWMQS